MQTSSFYFVHAEDQFGLCPNLVVCPAGLPHAQCLCVGELSLEAEQDPAVAEQQLQAILSKAGQVLVEARQHEAQQLPQVHLQIEKLLSSVLHKIRPSWWSETSACRTTYMSAHERFSRIDIRIIQCPTNHYLCASLHIRLWCCLNVIDMLTISKLFKVS